MEARPYISNFTAGELSPKLLGQATFAKYPNGCQKLENFLVWPQGMASKRPGSRFIGEVKDSRKQVRLIPFQFSVEQAYILEIGDYYFRIFLNRGQLLNDALEGTLSTFEEADSNLDAYQAGTLRAPWFFRNREEILALGDPVEIATPYSEDELFDLCYEQSADILYLTHEKHPPYQLERHSATDWRLVPYDFEDGPYLPINTTPQTLAPSAKTGRITLTAVPQGENLVKNGDFSQLSSGWGGKYDLNWSYDPDNWFFKDPKAACIAAGPPETRLLSQDIGAVGGNTYSVTYSIWDYTQGSVTVTLGGKRGTPRSANGTFTEVFVVVAAGPLAFDPDNFIGCIDDVVVRKAASETAFFYPEHVGSRWRIKEGAKWGWVEIIEYLNPIQVTALVRGADLLETFTVTEWREGAWSYYRGYPRVCAFYEDRLMFAGTTYQPQTVWGSCVGDYPSHAPDDGSATATDSGAVAFTLNARQVNTILWMASKKVLILGCSKGQWILGPTGTNEPLTPSNVSAKQETSLSSSKVFATADHTVLFWQKFGRALQEIAYHQESDSYTTTPLSVLAEHMGRPPVKEVIYLQEPMGLMLGVRTDGQIAALTYERQHEVVAWTRLVTDGEFESIATIPGADREEVYVVVKRTIDNQQKRYIEMLEDLENYEGGSEDLFYVDCGLTYSGYPATVISGLDHLEGKTVQVLADGAVQPDRVVSGGAITLARAASVVQVGLPFVSTLKTVRLEVQVPGGTVQGRRKRISQLIIRFFKSYYCKIGEREDRLDEVPFKVMGEPMDAPLVLSDDDKEVSFPGSYNRDAQVIIQHDLPLPVNILSLMPKLEYEP